jgi:hypothetical protein
LDPFYCPPSAVNLSGTVIGANGRQIAVPFQVANTESLVQTGNAAFSNLGGDFPSSIGGCRFFSAGRYSSESKANQAASGPDPTLPFDTNVFLAERWTFS